MPCCGGLDETHWCHFPSLAQCVSDTTNGRLWLENMIMYRLGSSSLSAMFISLRSKKQKMATGSGFGESTLVELA